MNCNICGKDYPSQYYFATPGVCTACFEKMSSDKQEEIRKLPDFQLIRNQQENNKEPGSEAIGALKLFAWLDLFASIIGSIWIWASLQVSGGIAIVVLLQGAISCALFLVIASIAENLILVRVHLEKSRSKSVLQ